MAAKKTKTTTQIIAELGLPKDFQPFSPKPGQEEMQKAFWKAHWAGNPSSGELYDGEL